MRWLPVLLLILFPLSPAGAVPARWEGAFIEPAKESRYAFRHPRIVAELVALGGEKYRLRILPEFFRRAPALFETTVHPPDFRFDSGSWRGAVEAGVLTGTAFTETENPVRFELKPSEFRPPSLGEPPPPGAILLFGGSDLSAWRAAGGERPAGWAVTKDGAVEVVSRGADRERGGDIRTIEEFGDARIHLEFRLPAQPDARGQARGNSGVYIQGLYEVQILDSFGLDGLWDECGALYKLWPPKVNACLAPGEWQTYDIDFRAARFDKDGRVLEYPRVTVRHNGVVIHRDEELPVATNHAGTNLPALPVPQRGPLLLQDHGNAVQFRNIWILPKQQ